MIGVAGKSAAPFQKPNSEKSGDFEKTLLIKPQEESTEIIEPYENVGERGIEAGKEGIKKKRKFSLGLIISVVLICAIFAVITVFAAAKLIKKPTISDNVFQLPSERTVSSDIADIVRKNDISGAIVNIEFLKQQENDRYQTYSVECEVTVDMEKSPKLYHITLVYEKEDDGWLLGNLNKIYEVEE